MSSATAWMIRNDGLEIPIKAHIYADQDETDELLAAAYFLWEHDEDSREIVHDFCDTWAYREFGRGIPGKFILNDAIEEGLKDYLKAKPYHIFAVEFVEVIARHVANTSRDWRKYASTQSPDGTDLLYALNQRFLRARYGGRKNTVPGCRDMFFRPSSVGFDWFPIIRRFVENFADMIETVTIVKDLESTGCEKYYIDTGGKSYNKMPLPEFFAGSGTTVPFKIMQHQLSEIFASGKPLRQLDKLRTQGGGQVRHILSKLKEIEESRLADV